MADDTAIQEAAQAYLCSVVDGIGLSNFNKVVAKLYAFETEKKKSQKKAVINFNDFAQIVNTVDSRETVLTEAYNKSFVDAPGVALNDIKKLFDKDDEWLKSSINIAKTLFEEIGNIDSNFTKIQRPGWKDIFYVRGDKEVMGNISKLFSIAKKNLDKSPDQLSRIGNVKFTNINKWSTADIYFASKNAKKEINDNLKNKHLDFLELNKLISDLIDSGDLLPLSLKKQPNKVTIKKVNFDRKKEEKLLAEIRYVGKSNWKPLYANDDGNGKITFHETKNSKGIGTGPAIPSAKYIAFYYSNKESLSKNENFRIQFRHDPSGESGGAYKGEVVTGTDAKAGSVSGEMIPELMQLFDSRAAATFKQDHASAKKDFQKEKKEENARIEKFKPIYSKSKRSKYKKGQSPYDYKMSELSNKYVGNKLNSLLIDFFESPSNAQERDRRIRKFIEYATATSAGSSKFVLAK